MNLCNLRIRYKLLLSYTAIFILAMMFGNMVIYSIVRKTIEANIESELKNSTTTILDMVRTAAAVSLKNYFRGVAEKNRDAAAYFYARYRAGRISEEEARKQASAFMLRQTIGTSGYIYCIDSQGIIRVHPRQALIGVNISEYPFVPKQKSKKNGYLEYDWQNPGEVRERAKALYMSYFEPWDWIISVTSYREEFSELVKVEDLRESILSLRFGQTGYSYVMDLEGNLVIHPRLEGENIFTEQDVGGRHFIQEVCRRKKGKIIYSWKNPEENFRRKKLVIFNHIPEFNWIVASCSYQDEFYAPLRTMSNSIFATAAVSLLLLLPISLRIGSSITSPLMELMARLSSVPDGNFTVRIQPRSQDEVGQLATYFNDFMARLESYSNSLREEIRERKQAEHALRLSEEMFSKAFGLSPSGLAIISWENRRLINVNASFLKAIRCTREEAADQSFAGPDFFLSRNGNGEVYDILEREERLRNHEVEYAARTGEIRLALMSADFIELWNERCVLLTLEDITDIKHLENKILDIGEKERQKIGQDLHDDLCPHLIGIEVLAKVLQHKLEREPREEAADVANIRMLIQDAIRKTRGMARGLCPVHLVKYGFESAVEELVVNTEKVFGISCEFRCAGPVKFHKPSDVTHLFYIIQEAVHNAVKHSNASHITVDLTRSEEQMCLRVTDDGIGISDRADSNGMGLRIMGFRAKKIGATFDVGPNSGKGTTVTISFRKERQRTGRVYDLQQG